MTTAPPPVLNPWLSMWTRPRRTMRQILDTNPTDLVLTTTKRRPNSAWAEPVAVLKRAKAEPVAPKKALGA